MEQFEEMKRFYRGKRVLVTGHTGFKGSWMCRALLMMGAEFYGYALMAEGENLYDIAGVSDKVHSCFADIRDRERLGSFVKEAQPELVIHMAAQPIVRESYRIPAETFEINVMGTVNLAESIRLLEDPPKVFLNVTTDKVYYNPDGRTEPFREGELLMGEDPYSSSKSCSELVTYSYAKAFLEAKTAVLTMRAGNVIGGGDFAADRLIPDCFRAVRDGREIVIRHPEGIRPFEHVLEAVMTYLYVAQRTYEDPSLAGSYNIGPSLSDCITAGEMAELFCSTWGPEAKAVNRPDGGPKEAGFLKLDCRKISETFGCQPHFSVRKAVELSVEWYRAYLTGSEEVGAVMDRQILQYLDQTGK
ncbi:MAG: CDP-glucose 4,6-dehydratase [Lachnospiraceae bacterium]|nr:CDP-glucose 4,6-dehydratase [Lachnospiraceae bacterium]